MKLSFRAKRRRHSTILVIPSAARNPAVCRRRQKAGFSLSRCSEDQSDSYTAAGFPQNLSNADFKSAAMAAASRDSMSRRGIM